MLWPTMFNDISKKYHRTHELINCLSLYFTCFQEVLVIASLISTARLGTESGTPASRVKLSLLDSVASQKKNTQRRLCFAPDWWKCLPVCSPAGSWKKNRYLAKSESYDAGSRERQGSCKRSWVSSGADSALSPSKAVNWRTGPSSAAQGLLQAVPGLPRA